MTFGLAEAVKWRPPEDWIRSINKRQFEVRDDARRKADWWELARKAADLMRREFGLTKIGVIGAPVRHAFTLRRLRRKDGTQG